MPAKKNITPQNQSEERLRLISNLFLSYTSDPVDNIRRIVALFGHILSAEFAFYNHVNGHQIKNLAKWPYTHDWPESEVPSGALCEEVLNGGKEDPVLIQNLADTSYYHSVPFLRAKGLNTYYGKLVECENKPVAVLCCLFKHDFTPTKGDEELIRILSSAASLQESLLQKMNTIREKEEKLQCLIDNSPKVAIQIYTREGVIKYWNSASEKLYGFSVQEAEGKTLDTLILSQDDMKEFLSILRKVDEESATITSEWNIKDKLGVEHYVMSTIFSITSRSSNHNGKDFVCMDFDLSELKEAERAQKDYAFQMEKVNATKDKFFSIIAHDLKNPFNSILGFSKILHEEYQDLNDEEILRFIKTIRDASENAFKLLQNLLVWSKIQTGHVDYSPEMISVSLISNETIALLKSQALAKNIQIISTVDLALQAYADENMIKTVYRNLVTNAIKYSFPGGKIVISGEDLGKSIWISVRDFGIGINENLLGKLFRIDENRERPGTMNEQGTGLGLILCREFVHQNGGEIMVESQEGGGSTFSFTLPKYKI